MADSKKYDGSQWEHSLRKLTTATEAVENPLYSDGTAITAYTLKGNEEHTGTPTPSNPVEVNGVGVRTENLFRIAQPISKPSDGYIYNGQFIFTESVLTFAATFDFSIAMVDNNNAEIINTNISANTPLTVNTPNGVKSLRIYISSELDEGYVMINAGSTAKPYEPYGYKIPIPSGGVTTNIYLGSTQTTRQIKKWVLTGEEEWSGSNGAFYLSSVNPDYMRGRNLILAVCSHYNSSPQGTSVTTVPDKSISFSSASSVQRFYLVDSSYTDTTGLQTYLQQQYANGTPVTVWYVLATAATAAVNEPLMKIGDYADTLSNATAIPTTEGANSITVDTTVQPSEFTATWTGWHNANIKEWDGSDWQ